MTDRPAPETEDAPYFELRERATDVLKIVDGEGEALVTIAPDGNVTIHNDADVNDVPPNPQERRNDFQLQDFAEIRAARVSAEDTPEKEATA